MVEKAEEGDQMKFHTKRTWINTILYLAKLTSMTQIDELIYQESSSFHGNISLNLLPDQTDSDRSKIDINKASFTEDFESIEEEECKAISPKNEEVSKYIDFPISGN